MKRLFFILVLMCCGFIYAETETYSVDSTIDFTVKKSNFFKDYSFASKTILAVLPYESGFVLKLQSKDNVVSEYYIYKGFLFYTYSSKYDTVQKKDIYTYYECKIIDIKPNEFTVDIKELKENQYLPE